MTVPLQGWVYYDTGSPVTTATVEVYNQVPALVTSGGVDATGMWSFSLADGVVYDVKVIVGSVVRWIKGGEKHQLANLSISGAFTFGSGVTITSGGLQVTAGGVGVGVAPTPSTYGVLIGGTLASTAVSDSALSALAVHPATATTSMWGIETAVTSANSGSAYTVTRVAGLKVAGNSRGSNSTITSNYGILVDPQTAGGTNNYGIWIDPPSGASVDNIGLVNHGSVVVNGSGTKLGFFGSVGNTAATVTGSRGSNLALVVQNLISTLAGYALIVDGTTA